MPLPPKLPQERTPSNQLPTTNHGQDLVANWQLFRKLKLLFPDFYATPARRLSNYVSFRRPRQRNLHNLLF